MQTKLTRSIVSIIFFLTAVSTASRAQSFRFSEDFIFVTTDGDTMELAQTGGLNTPRFSMADINNDGFQDLFIFDRAGNKPIALIFTTDKGYIHKPEYESVFPSLQDWAMFADYDNDGKTDLWGRNEYFNSVALFRNVTGSGDPFVRFEKVSDALMSYNFLEPPLDSNQVVCEKANVPAIVDIDNDGDLDFLTFQTFGLGVSFYLNNTKENKKPLHPPSFEVADECWGNFSESASSNEIFLERYKFCRRPYYRYKKHSGGSSMLLFDADGDKDKDLLLGNAGYNTIIFLKNGKSESSLKYDTIISFKENYPSTEPINIQTFPATFLLDLNHNDKPLLLASPSEVDDRTYSINQQNAVQMYENVSTNQVVDFKKINNHFLNTGILDHGGYSSPAISDVDGDGWPDILVLTNGNQSKTKNLSDRIYFYKNSGNGKSFQLKDEDLGSISKDSLKDCSIHLADIDNDTKPDLLIGKSDGTISFYKNATTGGVVKFQLISHKWQSIDGGDLASPCLTDINTDGLLDLLLGSYEGTLKYYQNTGTKSTPKFTPVTDNFGKILLNQMVLTTIFDPVKNDWVDTLLPASYGYSSVGSFIDKAGKLTLVCGGEEGVLRFFQPVSTNEGDYKEIPHFFFNSLTPNKAADIGARLKVALGDLNKDGYMDIVSGNSRGGISLLKGAETSGINSGLNRLNPKINLYPNPASTLLTIDTDAEILSSRIYSSTGQLALSSERAKTLNIDHLSSGSYIILIQTADGQMHSRKLIVIK